MLFLYNANDLRHGAVIFLRPIIHSYNARLKIMHLAHNLKKYIFIKTFHAKFRTDTFKKTTIVSYGNIEFDKA